MNGVFSASDARHASGRASGVPRLQPLPLLNASDASVTFGFSRTFTLPPLCCSCAAALYLNFLLTIKELRQLRQIGCKDHGYLISDASVLPNS